MEFQKLKNSFRHLIVIFLILIFLCVLILWKFHLSSFSQEEAVTTFQETNYQQQIDEYYNYCLSTPYVSEDTEASIQDFLERYQSDDFAVYFEDIYNHYTILKNEDKVYYGASLIKLLDATYLIRKALAFEVDLDTTVIVYEERFQKDYSTGMDSHQVGEAISLRDLIYYAIAYSDNTAHEMLFDYIGVLPLREYATSLGVSLSINEVEHFGNLTATMTHQILEEVYEILIMDNEYSELLRTAMNNTYFNSLNYGDIEILHKYGSYDPYFHDIGIYDDDSYPYFISIMSLIGEQASPNKITEIHQKIRAIYEANIEDKNEYCLEARDEYINSL